MADIQFEVADINTVDEEIRDAYVEKDGKFHFDPDKYHELRAKPLIAKNQQLIGIQKKLADEKHALEKIKSGAETDIEKVTADKDQQIAKLEKQLRESMIWTPVQDLAAKHGVVPDRIGDFMKILRSDGRFDQDEDGKLVFKDKDGYPTATKPTRAFEYYLKEEYPWAFEASKSAGSGAKPGSTSGAGLVIPRDRFDAMTQSERSKAVREGARIVD